MKRAIAAFVLCLGLAQPASAAPSGPEFHRAVYALHLRQIEGRVIRTEEETGTYEGVAAQGYRYRVTRYVDAATGQLLSQIQSDADAPDAVHIAEVNVYGADGRVVRDYFSSAPPWRPDAPSHAYLNLHHYNGKLHSFRQFELDGRVNYEACEGEWAGKRVRIAVDASDHSPTLVASAPYRACFDGMPSDWEAWVYPR